MSSYTPIRETEGLPLSRLIAPGDITNLSGTFGKFEVEEAAARIVAFFTDRGKWRDFTIEEMANFFRSKGWNPNTMFFGLLGGWWSDSGFGGDWIEPRHVYFAFTKDGTCLVTEEFIGKCAKNVRRAA